LAPGGENWYITIQDGWQYEFALELFNLANAPWVNSVSVCCDSIIALVACSLFFMKLTHSAYSMDGQNKSLARVVSHTPTARYAALFFKANNNKERANHADYVSLSL